MAENTDQQEKSNSQRLYLYSGIDKELYERLPNADKRAYNIIGIVTFCMASLFAVSAYFLAACLTASIAARVLACILGFAFFILLQKVVFGRLIHQPTVVTHVIFWINALLMAALFAIIYISANIEPGRFVSESVSETADTTSVMTVPIPDTTSSVADSSISK